MPITIEPPSGQQFQVVGRPSVSYGRIVGTETVILNKDAFPAFLRDNPNIFVISYTPVGPTSYRVQFTRHVRVEEMGLDTLRAYIDNPGIYIISTEAIGDNRYRVKYVERERRTTRFEMELRGPFGIWGFPILSLFKPYES